MSAFIAFFLLLVGLFTEAKGLVIASDLFAIAAEIAAYRKEE